jgi:Fe-S-cluster containining protein
MMKMNDLFDPSMKKPQAACGACHACCVVLPIREIDQKPAGVPCKHLCPSQGGCCGIYAERPDVCSGFECLWKMGFLKGPETYRPDQIGLMFWVNDVIVDDIQFIVAYETRPGARLEPKASYLIDKIAKAMPLFIKTHEGETKCYGPKDVLMRLMRDMEGRGLIQPGNMRLARRS